jgi:hypothetical protein
MILYSFLKYLVKTNLKNHCLSQTIYYLLYIDKKFDNNISKFTFIILKHFIN